MYIFNRTLVIMSVLVFCSLFWTLFLKGGSPLGKKSFLEAQDNPLKCYIQGWFGNESCHCSSIGLIQLILMTIWIYLLSHVHLQHSRTVHELGCVSRWHHHYHYGIQLALRIAKWTHIYRATSAEGRGNFFSPISCTEL